MLRWRLSLGALIIGSLMLLFWLDLRAETPGTFLFPLALLATPLAAGEIVRLMSVRQQRPHGLAVHAGSLMVVAASGVPHLWPDYPADCPLGVLGWPLLAFVAAALMAIVGEIVRYDKPERVASDLALTVFGIFYVGLLLSFIVQLRFVGGPAASGIGLISMLVVVKLCDVGAYTVGRLIGRHKLAPKLSPGKTIEGAAGGLLFGVAGSWLVLGIGAPKMSITAVDLHWSAIVVYGLVLGVVGVVGDLAESMLKRDAGFKDSSNWLPGFGGVLDLLDSPLLVAPVAYLLWGLVPLP